MLVLEMIGVACAAELTSFKVGKASDGFAEITDDETKGGELLEMLEHIKKLSKELEGSEVKPLDPLELDGVIRDDTLETIDTTLG